MTLGPLIIVSGPSGSGKSTLIGKMIGRFSPLLRHSISATTRKPRPGEEDRVHYHFWTRERFEQGIEAGEFLEYATVFGPEGEYAKRLRARGKDSEESIARRIAEARSELLRANEFDVRLLNDDLDRASTELNEMIDGLLNNIKPENAT